MALQKAQFLAAIAGGLILFGWSADADAREAKKVDSLDASMKRFVRALVESDRAAFLSFVSRETGLRWRNFQAVGDEPTLVSYDEIAADFRKKEGYYFVFLAREGAAGVEAAYDCFADYATQSNGRTWEKRGTTLFRPPGSDAELSKADPSVRWRKIGGKWMIIEISYGTA